MFIIQLLLIASAAGDVGFSDAFERETMVTLKDRPEFRVEGYWRNEYDASTSLYPSPKSRPDAWPRKAEFLAKLGAVETALKNADCLTYYRGLAPSRIEEDVYVGSCEFIDKTAKIVWPCGYLQHYIDKHNVVPSADFYDYIMDFDVSQIESCRELGEL